MRKTLLFIALAVATFQIGRAADREPATLRILPKDVAQTRVNALTVTNGFRVEIQYTEAGSNKVRAFDEAHQGQMVRIKIGGFTHSWFLSGTETPQVGASSARFQTGTSGR